MKLSTRGFIALAVSEGIVVYPYLDSVGVWTLGIGHTAAAGGIDPAKHIGKQYSVQEMIALFEKDIPKYEAVVNKEVKVPLAQHEFDALVHFVYNTGTLRTKNKNPSRLLSNLNKGNKFVAFNEGFHGWLKPASLRSRRDKERAMALRGVYGETSAPLYHVSKSNKPVLRGKYDLSYMLKQDNTSPIPPPPTQVPELQPRESFFTWLLRKLGWGK